MRSPFFKGLVPAKEGDFCSCFVRFLHFYVFVQLDFARIHKISIFRDFILINSPHGDKISKNGEILSFHFSL